MKRIFFSILGVVAASLLVYWLVSVASQDRQGKVEPLVIAAGGYSAAAAVLAEQINDISPTPPAYGKWQVREVEFVPGKPFLYVVYHDAHNVFRLLLRSEPGSRFRTVAAFEPDANRWRKTFGEDLPAGQDITVFIYDFKTQSWVERLQ